MREIIGNTTATPNPRPDWAQTDPTKADYIKNKPDGLATKTYVDAKIEEVCSATYTTQTVTLYTELWGDLNADGNIIHLKTVDGMTADALVEAAIAADQAMMEEACRCGVYCAAQGDNYLIFRAMYDTPTIDIDVIIKVTA